MVARKPDDERINRNQRTHNTTYIVWDGKRRGPECPTSVKSAEAKAWWEFVRNSPQAMLMQDSDWQQMIVAVRLYDQMYTPKKVSSKQGDIIDVPCTPGELRALSAEWRTYTETYGFTRQSRQRYGINIVTAEEIETEAVQAQIQAGKGKTQVVDYRTRLKG